MKKSILVFCSMFLGVGLLTGCGPTGDETSSNTTTTTTTATTTSTTDTKPIEIIEPPVYDEPSFQIHYHRDDNDYSDWDIWLWTVDDSNQGLGYEGAFAFNGQDEFGAIASYPLSQITGLEDRVGFIVRKGGDTWEDKDVASDQFFAFSDFTADENEVKHVYIISTWEGVYDSTNALYNDTILGARFTREDLVVLNTNTNFTNVKLYENDVKIAESTTEPRNAVRITLDAKPDFKKDYKVEVTFESGTILTADVDKNALFKTDSFDQNYTYDGELGAIYSKESTTFKVWAPGSKSMKLRLYENGTPTSVDATKGSDTYKEYDMTLTEKGVYEVKVDGDLEGQYYTYVVTNSKYTNQELVDPYAKSAGVNGLRGMIVDFSKTNPEGWDEVTVKPYKHTELVVYETHVADVTASESWTGSEANRLLFNGMAEEGTTYTENQVTVKTGFDHIKELGVNAVQIIPLFDQANDEVNKSFNWGYNPLNYNVIEGSYSSDPFDGYVRIKEFKNLVMKYNEAGINIIMDVVYNHVNSLETSSFNYLVPGYYFRYSTSGQVLDGSGCGNETASDMPMFRKFMIDSTEFWASEYKLGGFRFDLMGLHDIETMDELVANLKTINPDIVVYGEPWNAGTSGLTSTDAALQANLGKFNGYGAFNDKVRDGIKGSVFDSLTTGWATSLTSSLPSSIKDAIQGKTASFTSDPNKTVNYVSAHDNNTLFDKLQLSVAMANDDNIELLSNLSTLSNGIIFTSQGVSFMLAGEEFLRTKVKEDGSLDSNSYESSYKTNELDYSRLIDYPSVMEQYKEFISLKVNDEMFQLDNADDIKASLSFNDSDNSYIDYNLKYNNKEYRVIIMSRSASEKTLDLSGYSSVLADNLDTLTLSANSKLSSCQIVVVSK